MPHKSYNQVLDEHLHILIAQGSYEAFIKLKNRYHRHAKVLVTEFLSKYSYTGVTFHELICVCEEHFPFVVSKYKTGVSSFYTFWKSRTSRCLLNYLIENSYEGGASSFKGIISFDQKNEENHIYEELIGETADERKIKRRVFEIKYILHKYDAFFTHLEKTVINFVIEGYSLQDFEQIGVLKKSQINLTYKSASNKIKKYLNEIYE